MGSSTTYLFATPTFSSGMSGVLDMGATLNGYNINQTPEEADRKALLSDWRMVGTDIRSALSSYEQAS
jgi:hypothetical protein